MASTGFIAGEFMSGCGDAFQVTFVLFGLDPLYCPLFGQGWGSLPLD